MIETILTAQDLLAHLHRGGTHAYFWTNPGKRSTWYEVGDPAPVPRGDVDVYFGVHPTNQAKDAAHRSTIADVAAIGCLFAEFDAKDLGDKDTVLDHVLGLDPAPSVIVDSGGGYHCYWLLAEPYALTTDTKRERARAIQRRWVEMVGGDPGAKDLARVLRVPGTRNLKYDDRPEVLMIQADFSRLYELDDLEALLPEEPPAQSPKADRFNGRVTAWAEAALAGEIQNVMTARDGARNDTLNRAAFALGQIVAGGELDAATVEQSLTAAALAVGLNEKETAATIASGMRAGIQQPRIAPSLDPPMPPDDNGSLQIDAIQDKTNTNLSPHTPTLEIVKRTLALGETGDGELLATMYSDKLVYDHSEKAWYLWNGHTWQKDLTAETSNLVAYQVAAEYLRAAADLTSVGDEKGAQAMADRARRLRQRNKINNVLDRAKSQRALAVTGEEWDKDPWIIGVENGVIDLETGELRTGRPADYIRKTAPTAYHGKNVRAPRWERFLTEVFAGDKETITFMQRLLGYGLTGLAVEHVLPILWGEGRNGKGTLLEAIGGVMGSDLATPTDASTLMMAGNSNGGLQPFVYDLRGTRLVWASESNEGRRLDAALVKKLTGGDTVKVRTLHSLPVTFKPTYLILLLTNYKPHVNADDQAIWDRIHLIPFTQRFVDNPQAENEHRKDKTLSNKLQVEASGILAWLVRGCLAWQREGLNPPQSVKVATEDYRTEEDTLGLFIEERLIFQEGMIVRGQELYDEYKTWCSENNLYAMSGTKFGMKIKRKLKIQPKKSMGYIIYNDVGLLFREG